MKMATASKDKKEGFAKMIAHSKSKGNSKVGKVMGEFKRGNLHSGSKKGPKVTDKRQAMAIALKKAKEGKGSFSEKEGRDEGLY